MIAVVGAGAAGLAAAIFAARRGARDVVVVDGARTLGAKILVSGGSRCNVTNTVVRAEDFSGGNRHLVRRILKSFPAGEAVAFFREIGVSLHEEEGGKLFPDTNRARTVLDALVGEARARGVALRPGHRVHAIGRAGDAFRLETSAGALAARRIVIATGGLSLPKTGSDGAGYGFAQGLGHSLVPRTPALVPLVLNGDFHAGLSGVSQPVEIAVHVEGEKPVRIRGAMLWAHFGVSGPAALDASRHWHRARVDGHDVRLTASFLPDDDFAGADGRFLALAGARPRLALANALAGLVPASLAAALLSSLGIDGGTALGRLPRDDRRRLVHALTAWPLDVKDSRGYGFAEVTAGGVPLEEIDPATMASRRCPGLFLVGEVLDVDGRIGGFNFQWAWSTGWLAGSALAAAVL